ncbi:MAG: dTDP-glucose 4,6-dehydratase [Candidatus Omnitrophota bacterium]|jgi:dTDP-glucose 4,6-dehydratase
MGKGKLKIAVTGGAGFIGSAFVRLLINRNKKVIVIDKLTYAGDLARLKEVEGRYKFYQADICDETAIESIFKKEKPEIIVNFAAETHVDRSILDAGAFLQTNVIGTRVLLDLSKKYRLKRFVHISTDEVYGDIKKGKFHENSPLKPNSPYAASKASADLLIRSYIRTYGFPAIIIRPCNNYGPWQYPEKLIPLAILAVLKGERVPVYADGKNIREWLYVEDSAGGILKILEKGKIGGIYNLGSRQEMQNIEVVKSILKKMKQPGSLIKFVKDRPGHDFRYSLDSRKVFKELGWRPKLGFTAGLDFTVEWCLRHKDWLLDAGKEIKK